MSRLTMNQRVGVLMGGTSSERAVSLRSGAAILAALQRQGHDAIGIDLTDNWAEVIRDARIDTAFIALHGTHGEDGCIQGMLEIMGIPYTGSGVTASALCMNKRLTKQILNAADIRTPVDIPLDEHGPARFPVFIKPVAEGSSVGVSRLENRQAWESLAVSNPADWLAEMPVSGPEIAVSVLDGKALPPVEIAPHSGVYDYASKYTKGATDYHCPARLPVETLRYCMQKAEATVLACGCSGAPRVDMIVADGGEPVVLEVNTIPGMTETSLLPKSAAAAGIDFDTLCRRILDSAALEHANAMREGEQ